MNVGQGAFFLQRKTNNLVIIDAGSDKNEIAQPTIEGTFRKEMISNHGVRAKLLKQIFNGAQLQRIIITHADKDHYSYIEYILKYMAKNTNTTIPSPLKIIIGMNHEDKKFPVVEKCEGAVRVYNESRNNKSESANSINVEVDIYAYNNSMENGNRLKKIQCIYKKV